MSQQSPVITDATVINTLRQAWHESRPGVVGGHEEGGFIVQNAQGELRVIRWPKGAQNTIALPPHPNCKIETDDIVATFHTHPNTGRDYLQEPSETDKRAVRDDPDLKGALYEGEYVISQAIVYLITPNGQVMQVGLRQEMLGA